LNDFYFTFYYLPDDRSTQNQKNPAVSVMGFSNNT